MEDGSSLSSAQKISSRLYLPWDTLDYILVRYFCKMCFNIIISFTSTLEVICFFEFSAKILCAFLISPTHFRCFSHFAHTEYRPNPSTFFRKNVMSTPWRSMGGAEEHLHSFLTSTQDGDEWSTQCPGRLISRKEPRYRLNGKVGGPQSWFGFFGEEKNFLPLRRFDPRTLSVVRSCILSSC
jgi:hypothetical protein